MPNLHDAGWRQGSIVSASLTVQIHTVRDGVACTEDVVHNAWMLAEQDCDLAQTDENDSEKRFELRAVRDHAGDIPSGITGSRVRIDDTRCLLAMDVIAKVSASWLTTNIGGKEDLDPEVRRYIKTWLGLRYDRPAVPDEFRTVHARIQDLARSERAIRDERVKPAKWVRLDMAKVRDLLVGYDAPGTNGKVRAYISAIAKDPADVPELQAWVERIRDAVGPDENLIVAEVDALDPDTATLSLLERSFSIYGDAHSLDKASNSDEAA